MFRLIAVLLVMLCGSKVLAEPMSAKIVKFVQPSEMIPAVGSSCTFTTYSAGSNLVPVWSCALGSTLSFTSVVASTKIWVSVVTAPASNPANTSHYCVIPYAHVSYSSNNRYKHSSSDVRIPTPNITPLPYVYHQVGTSDIAKVILPNYTTAAENDILVLNTITGNPPTGSDLSNLWNNFINIDIRVVSCSSICSFPNPPSCCSNSCSDYSGNVYILGAYYVAG